MIGGILISLVFWTAFAASLLAGVGVVPAFCIAVVAMLTAFAIALAAVEGRG